MALATEVSHKALAGMDVETVLEPLAAGVEILPVSEATVSEDINSKYRFLFRTRGRGSLSDHASIFG